MQSSKTTEDRSDLFLLNPTSCLLLVMLSNGAGTSHSRGHGSTVRGLCSSVAESQDSGEETWILDQSCTAADRAQAKEYRFYNENDNLDTDKQKTWA